MLTESLEIKGLWWLPDSPEAHVAGTLSYSPEEGILLDLIGSFHDITQLNRLEEIPIVNGVAGGKRVTLTSLHTLRSTFQVPGVHISTLRARFAFLGELFPTPDSIRFTSVSVAYLHLNEWLNPSNIEIDRTADRTTTITVRNPEPERFELPGDLSISIGFTQSGPGWSLGSPEVSVRQQAHVRLELPGPSPYESFAETIHHFQHFLTLAVGSHSPPISVHAVPLSIEAPAQPHAAPTIIELLYQPVEIPDTKRRIIPEQMLLPFHNVNADLHGTLTRWFQADDALRTVFGLFFATKLSSRMFLENRFLGLLQSMESFHRLAIAGTTLPPAEFRSRLDSVLAPAPSELHAWLRTSLQFANEKSLRLRLREIIDQFPRLSAEVLHPDAQSVIALAVDTRNYLTHYDPALRDRSARGLDLYRLIQRLTAFMHASMVSYLGFEIAFAEDSVLTQHDQLP